MMMMITIIILIALVFNFTVTTVARETKGRQVKILAKWYREKTV